ncbi:MAG: hypothetical protein EXS37_09075 [Opitutus sp.]|nr:hypothetical protein [Opitutus sp.]
MFRPGEIVIAAFPFSALTASKRRPCLMVAACDSPGDFLVAFITSVSANPAWRCAVALEPSHPEWRRTGLKCPSALRVDKLTTLHSSVMSGAIGVLPDDLMAVARMRIKVWLGL